MDFGQLLNVAQQNGKSKKEIQYYKTKFEPPKKEQRSRQLSENIKKFLERQREEEKRKQQEEARKKAELLALRATDKKATKRVNVMLKRTKSANQSVIQDAVDKDHTAVTLAGPDQPDEDDYGYVSQESSAMYNKMMEKYRNMPEEPKFNFGRKKCSSNLSGTKDRVKAALEREREEALLPHKRKRKHDSVPNDDWDRNISEKEEKSKNSPEPAKPKAKNRPPAPPPMNFADLLKIAEKKQFEPIIIEPKVKEEEKLLTKKQKKEMEKEKEARERRDARERERLNNNNNNSNTNRIPKIGEKSSKDDRIPKIGEKSSKEDRLPKLGDDNRKKLVPSKNIPPNNRNYSPSSSSASSSAKISDSRPELKKSLPSKPQPNAGNGKILASALMKKEMDMKKDFKARELPSKMGRDDKIRKLPLQDGKPKQFPPADTKPKQFPPPDVKSRQFPPPDVKSRQFPPPDVKSRQFPPGDVRRKPEKKLQISKKRQIIDDDDSEYDSEMDDFIDDGPLDAENDYSKYISEIFGYDKSRYRHIDDDVDNMESTFAQQMREEVISTKIGIMEDLEDMKKEEEEKRRKMMMKKKRTL